MTVAAGSLGDPALDYTKLFDEVSRQVKDAGLMKPRPKLYTAWIVLNTLLVAAGFAAVALAGDSWWVLLVAVYLAFVHGQNALTAHDVGHRQVYRTRKTTELVGYFSGNAVMGVSYGWWVWHHNKHHGNPNHIDLDPDIVRRQVIFSTSQLPTRKGAVSRFIIRHQSWAFFVIITMESFRLHLAGFIAAAKGVITRNKALDVTLLTVHLAGYFVFVFWMLPFGLGVLFVLVHQMLFGFYLGILFAPNHKGLPVRDGEETLEWCRRQIITSRNQISNRVIDYVMGGLNYQIEHHLFPAMPSVNLRRARPIVMAFCEKYRLPYVEVGFMQSYREVSRFLGEISDQSRPLMAGKQEESV